MNFFLKYIENELLICLVGNQPNNFVLTEISKNRSHVISRTFLQKLFGASQVQNFKKDFCYNSFTTPLTKFHDIMYWRTSQHYDFL